MDNNPNAPNQKSFVVYISKRFSIVGNKIINIVRTFRNTITKTSCYLKRRSK